jgi:hypothetical protein
VTIDDGMGEQISTVLLRLNLLLRKGYRLEVQPDSPEVVFLEHPYFLDLNLILNPDGLVVNTLPKLLGENSEGQIRIREEEHQEFLEFLDSLPKLTLLQRIYSVLMRSMK